MVVKQILTSGGKRTIKREQQAAKFLKRKGNNR